VSKSIESLATQELESGDGVLLYGVFAEDYGYQTRFGVRVEGAGVIVLVQGQADMTPVRVDLTPAAALEVAAAIVERHGAS